MSKEIIIRQQFKYNEHNPIHVYNQKGYMAGETEGIFTAHWHTEIELVYLFKGWVTHYIDGIRIENKPGKLVIANSESVHSIMVNSVHEGMAGVVVIIAREYLEQIIPRFSNMYFIQQNGEARIEIQEIMLQISKYVDKNLKKGSNEYGDLYLKGLVHLLLHYMMEDGVREKNQYLTINQQKNIERLRGVIDYIQEHYKENFTQQEVAEKFYFSSSYLSRFFKENTGQNFTGYINYYRAEQARRDLIFSDNSVLDIALEHGFSDSRGFINAFKKMYGITPLQFRKKINKK